MLTLEVLPPGQWRPVPALERYYASSEGEVYSVRGKGRYLKMRVDRYGYRRAGFAQPNGKKKVMSIHRAVASAWLDNPERLPSVNHKNGNKQDNRVANLEWCTWAHNTHHAIESGLLKPTKGPATLSWATVQEIRQALAEGESQRAIAARFNTYQSTVSRINSGDTYGSEAIHNTPKKD